MITSKFLTANAHRSVASSATSAAASLPSNAQQNKSRPPSGIPANNKYKNVLLLCKTSRLTRYEKKGLNMTPYIEKVYKHTLTDTHKQHHGVIELFADQARKMGKNVTIRFDEDLSQKDINNHDIVVSLGK